MSEMTIGEVARRTGLRPSAIRYYERVGLLETPGRVGGQRRYGDDVLTRLALVRMGQRAGFSLDEIRTLLSGFPDGTPPPLRWQELAGRKLPEVDAMIRRMQTVRRVMEESLQCDCPTLDASADHGWEHGTEDGPTGILTSIDEWPRVSVDERG